MPLSQLLAEFFGSILADKIGLPCPKACLVEITPTALQYIRSDWRLDLALGAAFASAYFKEAKVAKTAQAKSICEQTQKLLYMFDTWILNADRTASKVGTGNINLLYVESDQEILVIDHNLAFDEQADMSSHIFSPQNRTWQIGLISKYSQAWLWLFCLILIIFKIRSPMTGFLMTLAN